MLDGTEIPLETSQFSRKDQSSAYDLSISSLRQSNIKDLSVAEHFDYLKLLNLKNRIQVRNWISGAVIFLLFCQNSFIAVLIFKAFKYGTLFKLQPFFATLFTFTLAETYVLLKFIVGWLFKDEKYGSDGEINNKTN